MSSNNNYNIIPDDEFLDFNMNSVQVEHIEKKETSINNIQTQTNELTNNESIDQLITIAKKSGIDDNDYNNFITILNNQYNNLNDEQKNIIYTYCMVNDHQTLKQLFTDKNFKFNELNNKNIILKLILAANTPTKEDLAEKILTDNPNLINNSNIQNKSPLEYAIENSYFKAALWLINKNVEITPEDKTKYLDKMKEKNIDPTSSLYIFELNIKLGKTTKEILKLTNSHENFLKCCVSLGLNEDIKQLLEKDKTPLINNHKLLSLSIENKQLDTALILIKYGAANTKENKKELLNTLKENDIRIYNGFRGGFKNGIKHIELNVKAGNTRAISFTIVAMSVLLISCVGASILFGIFVAPYIKRENLEKPIKLFTNLIKNKNINPKKLEI